MRANCQARYSFTSPDLPLPRGPQGLYVGDGYKFLKRFESLYPETESNLQERKTESQRTTNPGGQHDRIQRALQGALTRGAHPAPRLRSPPREGFRRRAFGNDRDRVRVRAERFAGGAHPLP